MLHIKLNADDFTEDQLTELMDSRPGQVIFVPESSPDANVEAVRKKMLDRSVVGLAKYGVTTERKDLSRIQWLNHLQEELMDAANYLQVLIELESKNERTNQQTASTP